MAIPARKLQPVYVHGNMQLPLQPPSEHTASLNRKDPVEVRRYKERTNKGTTVQNTYNFFACKRTFATISVVAMVLAMYTDNLDSSASLFSGTTTWTSNLPPPADAVLVADKQWGTINGITKQWDSQLVVEHYKHRGASFGDGTVTSDSIVGYGGTIKGCHYSHLLASPWWPPTVAGYAGWLSAVNAIIEAKKGKQLYASVKLCVKQEAAPALTAFPHACNVTNNLSCTSCPLRFTVASCFVPALFATRAWLV